MKDLKPMNLTIQFIDHSIRCPMRTQEGIPVQLGKFITSCDFILMDMDESFQVPIILGRSFLITIGAMIDVPTG